MTIQPVTLETSTQRLSLLPEMGGAVATWEWHADGQWTPIFRPWDGQSDDRYSFACFPLIPWSNRITHGGFTHNGTFHPITPNRPGEPYPIHGDGWLQSWEIATQTENRISLSLESHQYEGNPYDYTGTLTYTLLPDGLAIELSVTHAGDNPLPYGLGLHPYFMRTPETRFQAKTTGVWLSGDDPIPTEHTTELPATWDYTTPSSLDGPLIDNCFTGWDGNAAITYPDRNLTVTMTMADCNGYSLMYRPPDMPHFCFEPITHPIDAFHMPDQPGLVLLDKGQSMNLRVRFQIAPFDTSTSKTVR